MAKIEVMPLENALKMVKCNWKVSTIATGERWSDELYLKQLSEQY